MDITVKDAGRGTRWVCPNDRHLALRAKLRTGWSVKTGSLDSKWGTDSNSYSSNSSKHAQSFVLTEDEQHAIIQVIQRAEALDLSEQERIGRLVERLENMKRNVCIVTATRMNERKGCSSRCSNSPHCVCSCALCGEKFGTVLGASPYLCKDCRKYICQKCGIETHELNASCSNISLMKERTTMQRIVRRSSNNQRQFLCRICAETREMWKKSGAWFLKGMPKYILPEKKERGWSRPVHKTSTWTIGGNKSLESSELQDSSSDEEATRRLALARGQSNSFSSLQKNQNSITNKSHSTQSNSAQSTNSASKSSGQRSNGLSPLNSRDECSDRLDRSTLSIVSQCSRLSPTPTSPRSRTSPKHSNDLQIEQRVSFEDEIINEEKTKKYDINELNESIRKLEFNMYDQPKNTQTEFDSGTNYNGYVNGICSGTGSNSREICESRRASFAQGTGEFPRLARQSSNRSTKTATSEMRTEPKLWNSRSLLAIRPSSSVPPMQSGTCQRFTTNGYSWSRRSVLQAQHITNKHGCDYETSQNKNGSSNTRSGIQRDSKFLRNNGNGCTTNLWNGKSLHILILQDDPAGQDFLGEAKFPLYELQPRQTKHYNVPLQNHYPVDNEEAVWGEFPNGRGQIQLSLCYCTKRRALSVTVHRATNLLPMDSNGFSDPFVKLCLIENVTNNRLRVFDYSIVRITAKKLVPKKIAGRNSQSTTVKWKTLNPEWNEEFHFSIRLTDLMKFTLCLTVWDKDFGKSNDYLGGLELNCNSKGARLRHWIDTIRFPDHHHQACYNLIDTVLPAD